jgi:hypothetical protein
LLQSEGFNDDAALDQAIKKLEADLKKTRKKAANDGDDVIVSTHFLILWALSIILYRRKSPPSRSLTRRMTRYARKNHHVMLVNI